MRFLWSLSDSKSPQISSTLPSILADCYIIAELINEWHFLFTKIYVSLFFSFSQGIYGVRKTDGDKRGRRETKGDCHIAPWLLLQTILLCVIFKTQLSPSSLSRPGGTQLRACSRLFCWTLPQRGTQSLADILRDSTNIFWPQAKTDSRLNVFHLGICMYHNAHHFRSTPWLLPLIYTGVSCAEKSLIDGSVKSQYATWSQQCCSLDVLDSFSDFQIFPSFFQTFGDCSKRTNNKNPLKKCCIGCSSGYHINREKVSNFSFPLGKSDLIEKWMKFVHRNEWFPTKIQFSVSNILMKNLF